MHNFFFSRKPEKKTLQVSPVNLGGVGLPLTQVFFVFGLRNMLALIALVGSSELLYSCTSSPCSCGFCLQRNRGSYMSAHVLVNLLNELGKRVKM